MHSPREGGLHPASALGPGVGVGADARHLLKGGARAHGQLEHHADVHLPHNHQWLAVG